MSKEIKKNQIISITGATATGKTNLALQVAEALAQKKPTSKIYLLSVDSRQVYQGLEILTGADLPHGWQVKRKQPYRHWQHPELKISLHGVSIVPIWQDWSAAHFKKLYLSLKEKLRHQDYLILVGGTGFYHRQIEAGADSLFIPQDQKLRQRYSQKSVAFLQEKLKQLDSEKLANMNRSDANNPRRLIRAIEIAQFLKTQDNNSTQTKKQAREEILKIHLELNRHDREEKIIRRVEGRFKHAIHEVRACLKEFKLAQQLPAASATGFQELAGLINHDLKQEQALKKWILSEIQYAKRQDTWWNKVSDLNVFRADDPELLKKSLALIGD